MDTAMLITQVEEDMEPISASDSELLALASAACTELRRRMPRYGFEQGDLDDEDEQAVAQMESAEDACAAVAAMREAWTV